MDSTSRSYARIKQYLNQIITEYNDRYRDDDDYKWVDELGQRLGLTLYPHARSDGCELRLYYTYEIYFRDFIGRPAEFKPFVDSVRS